MRFSELRNRAVGSVRNYLRRELDAEVINMDGIEPFQRHHLQKFYFVLLCVSASSTLGSYFTENIGSYLAVFGAFMSDVCFYFLSPMHEKKRVCLLSLGAFFGVAFLARWLTWFLSIDAGFIVTMLLATSVGFGCYWVPNNWTGRYNFVYFRALLLCCALFLPILNITSSVFGGDSARWKAKLYGLLLWYMLHVAVYSHEVVLKARRGENDYVKHAIRLFTGLVIHVAKVYLLLVAIAITEMEIWAVLNILLHR